MRYSILQEFKRDGCLIISLSFRVCLARRWIFHRVYEDWLVLHQTYGYLAADTPSALLVSNLPEGRRLSWPALLVTYQDGRSISVLTALDVEQLR